MRPVPTASIALCLACSASLPPKADSPTFYTTCCSRPICPKCISTNPRLTRYNPCLRCLAGVKAVNSQLLGVSSGAKGNAPPTRTNIHGSIRDEDIFVLEDGDEDEDDLETDEGGQTLSTEATPTQVSPSLLNDGNGAHDITDACQSDALKASEATPGLPSKYFIRPDDTLLGISLRLRIDSRALCRLNNLPVSTIRTNPHLLHTRSFLILPPSARAPPPLTAAEQALDEERRARLAIERAETRFQAITKETDRDVAKAYVALAGMPDVDDTKECKKETANGLRKRRVRMPVDASGSGETGLDERAMDQYFDDDDWESREQAEGRKVSLQPFPYFSQQPTTRTAGNLSAQGDQKPWWRWRT
ncbi:hypothetical protein C8Q74DRAFT_1197093 [Fomes fomentarius]|nr:hypothetical protein C8Q74DRAFT_1197093 [Fomes fomentarius]